MEEAVETLWAAKGANPVGFHKIFSLPLTIKLPRHPQPGCLSSAYTAEMWKALPQPHIVTGLPDTTAGGRDRGHGEWRLYGIDFRINKKNAGEDWTTVVGCVES